MYYNMSTRWSRPGSILPEHVPRAHLRSRKHIAGPNPGPAWKASDGAFNQPFKQHQQAWREGSLIRVSEWNTGKDNYRVQRPRAMGVGDKGRFESSSARSIDKMMTCDCPC